MAQVLAFKPRRTLTPQPARPSDAPSATHIILGVMAGLSLWLAVVLVWAGFDWLAAARFTAMASGVAS